MEVAGGNILGRWKRIFSDSSDMTIQLYYDFTEREDAMIEQFHDTFDIDFYHRFAFGERQAITWGLGYRFVQDEIDNNSNTFLFKPRRRNNHLYSTFVQDEVTLVPDRLKFTFGSKFEHNAYTRIELQPSSQLLWTPGRNHTVWASVSRAVRIPSRFNNDVTFNSLKPGVGLTSIKGTHDIESEDLLASEIGYRILMLHNQLSFDIAAFFNLYDDLNLVVSNVLTNEMDGETYGVEISAKYHPTDRWLLYGGYTYLQLELQPTPSGGATLSGEGNNPDHQFQVRSNLDLPYGLEFDTALYYVDSLIGQRVASHVRLDTRFGWHLSENLDVSMGLQNILEPRHEEFGSGRGVNATEVERSIFGQITWHH